MMASIEARPTPVSFTSLAITESSASFGSPSAADTQQAARSRSIFWVGVIALNFEVRSVLYQGKDNRPAKVWRLQQPLFVAGLVKVLMTRANRGMAESLATSAIAFRNGTRQSFDDLDYPQHCQKSGDFRYIVIR